MGQGGGRLLRRFFHPMQEFLNEAMAEPEMAEFTKPLVKAFANLQQLTLHLAQKGLADPEEVGAAASEYLRFFGLVAIGWMWARMARTALAKQAQQGGDDTDFYRNKLITARFYMTRVLPETASLGLSIMAGKKAMMELEDAAF